MRTLLTLFLLLVMLRASAQSEFSLYRLNANLPQANLLNPAFSPNSKLVIGLPVISSIYVAADNDGIAFRDLFKNSENDSLQLDTLTLFSKLNPSNRIQFKEAIQLFYFGLRGKKGYLSFGIHQVSETRFNYPGDLVGWAIRGPGNYQYAGKPLDFGNFYGRSIVYNKVSLNYARDITPKLRIGARFNYLLGVAAGETTTINGKLTMGIDSVNINTGRLHFQTAGVDFFDQDNLSASDYKNYFLNSKNKGMSWDFGATYELTKRLTLSAALNDLGYISWKDYTRSYTVDPINYTFKGFDLLDYLNQSSGQQFLEAEIDSLENLFTATETTGNKFKTSLIGKFYAGANFRILKVNNFSALFYLDLFQKRINPAVSLGYNLQLGRLLNTTVGITYQNRTISNIGAGIALKLTHMQIYATSDRANSFIYPARASRGDAHFGMNFVFGKPKKNRDKDDIDKEEKEEEQEEKQEPIKEEEPKQDSVNAVQPSVIEPAPTDTIKNEPQPETVAEPVVIQPEIKEEIVSTPVPEIKPEEPVVQPTEEPRHEVVKKGAHEDELAVGHYVIAGAFRLKENARRYSKLLKDAGYENQFGFVTEKNLYYVSVHQSASLEETRSRRDEYRQMSEFQFSDSWVLTVSE